MRNYPWYKGWQNAFANKGLTIIGIHTPEGGGEFDFEQMKHKAEEAEFKFPIVTDNDKKNWNAWGNSMWPSVYLVDKKGYIRHWWYGELNWQGQDGEQQMRRRIEELLAESE